MEVMELKKKIEENIPPVLIQVWDQSQCKICKDPTMSLSGIGLTSVDLSKKVFR